LTNLRELLACAVDLVVAKQVDVARGRLSALLKTGMAQRIHHDMVVGPDEALDHAEAGSPARRKQRDMIIAEKLGDFLFQRQGKRSVADKRRRAGAVHAERAHRLCGDIDDPRMRREAQIILAREIDAPEQCAFVRARAAAAVSAVLRRAAKRPDSNGTARLLPFVEAVQSREDVGTVEVPEIAHASFQRSAFRACAVVGHRHRIGSIVRA
jgi:hypothetical protein